MIKRNMKRYGKPLLLCYTAIVLLYLLAAFFIGDDFTVFQVPDIKTVIDEHVWFFLLLRAFLFFGIYLYLSHKLENGIDDKRKANKACASVKLILIAFFVVSELIRFVMGGYDVL